MLCGLLRPPYTEDMQGTDNPIKTDKKILEYKVTLKKSGVVLLEDEEISKRQYLRILQIVESDEVIPNFSSLSGFSIDSSFSKSSPREYLTSVNAKSGPELATAVLSYLKRSLNKISAEPAEIKDQILKSGEAVPVNLAQDLKRAVSRGWIASNEGLYYITNTGEEILTNGFKLKTGFTKKRRKGVKLTPTIVRSEIEKLEIESLGGDDIPNFWDLGTKSDRLLWILNFAKDKSFDRLNFKEISILASKLGDNIIPRQISSLAITHRKKNRLVMSTELGTTFVRILEPGVIYLKKIKGGVAESD